MGRRRYYAGAGRRATGELQRSPTRETRDVPDVGIREHLRAAEAAGAGRVRFGEHPDQGGTAFTFAMIFTGAVVVFFVVDRFGERITGRKPPKWTPLGMYAIVSVIGLLSLLTMVQAGHSGAALVWKDVGSYAAGK